MKDNSDAGMAMQFNIQNLSDLEQIAGELIAFAEPDKKVAFYGEMGTGKTTLIKVVSRRLGVKDLVSSPTFSLINEYFSPIAGRIYHFDFYRVRSIDEVRNLGITEFFDSPNWCFIEWPENAGNLLPSSFVKVKMVQGNNDRHIELSR